MDSSSRTKEDVPASMQSMAIHTDSSFQGDDSLKSILSLPGDARIRRKGVMITITITIIIGVDARPLERLRPSDVNWRAPGSMRRRNVGDRYVGSRWVVHDADAQITDISFMSASAKAIADWRWPDGNHPAWETEMRSLKPARRTLAG